MYTYSDVVQTELFIVLAGFQDLIDILQRCCAKLPETAVASSGGSGQRPNLLRHPKTGNLPTPGGDQAKLWENLEVMGVIIWKNPRVMGKQWYDGEVHPGWSWYGTMVYMMVYQVSSWYHSSSWGSNDWYDISWFIMVFGIPSSKEGSSSLKRNSFGHQKIGDVSIVR